MPSPKPTGGAILETACQVCYSISYGNFAALRAGRQHYNRMKIGRWNISYEW